MSARQALTLIEPVGQALLEQEEREMQRQWEEAAEARSREQAAGAQTLPEIPAPVCGNGWRDRTFAPGKRANGEGRRTAQRGCLSRGQGGGSVCGGTRATPLRAGARGAGGCRR